MITDLKKHGGLICQRTVMSGLQSNLYPIIELKSVNAIFMWIRTRTERVIPQIREQDYETQRSSSRV